MYSLILFFPLDFFFLLPTDIVGGNGELVCNVSDGAMDMMKNVVHICTSPS